jgi:hypothetical protein
LTPTTIPAKLVNHCLTLIKNDKSKLIQ